MPDNGVPVKPLTLKAPAKINLGLVVKGKRADGYHELETLMQMVALYDRITLVPQASGIRVMCDTPGVPTGRSNLAYRAAQALRQVAGIRKGVRIVLEKNVPTAAGLGGGSSDAAATLAGLVKLWGLRGMHRKDLMAVAATLGSDVPFFLFGPAALARGRGELLDAVPPAPECWVVLVTPGVRVSTAWVYRNYERRAAGLTTPPNRIRLLQLVLFNQDLGGLARHLHNDLEPVTAARYPQVRAIKTKLVEAGALGACMSGSGPTVFGLFQSREHARRAQRRMLRNGWRAVLAKVLSVSPLEALIAETPSGIGRSAAARRCGR